MCAARLLYISIKGYRKMNMKKIRYKQFVLNEMYTSILITL